jgi:hypothetical protein
MRIQHDENDKCSQSETGTHHPDWNTVIIDHDGGEAYVDVNCVYCGRSGCVGTSKTLANGISW